MSSGGNGARAGRRDATGRAPSRRTIATPKKVPAQSKSAVRLGRYELLSLIGEGGMADVYLAELTGPEGFRKQIALKVIRPSIAARDDGLLLPSAPLEAPTSAPERATASAHPSTQEEQGDAGSVYPAEAYLRLAHPNPVLVASRGADQSFELVVTGAEQVAAFVRVRLPSQDWEVHPMSRHAHDIWVASVAIPRDLAEGRGEYYFQAAVPGEPASGVGLGGQGHTFAFEVR